MAISLNGSTSLITGVRFNSPTNNVNEVWFDGVKVWPDEYIVNITTSMQNVNLKSLFTSTYPGVTPRATDRVIYKVSKNVVISGSTTSTYALITGTWSPVPNIVLDCTAGGIHISGRGGNGASATIAPTNNVTYTSNFTLTPAGVGGPGILLTVPLAITGSATITGGGGGGGFHITSWIAVGGGYNTGSAGATRITGGSGGAGGSGGVGGAGAARSNNKVAGTTRHSSGPLTDVAGNGSNLYPGTIASVDGSSGGLPGQAGTGLIMLPVYMGQMMRDGLLTYTGDLAALHIHMDGAPAGVAVTGAAMLTTSSGITINN